MKESNYHIMLRLMIQHDLDTFIDMCDRALEKSKITVSEYDKLVAIKKRCDEKVVTKKGDAYDASF